MFITLYFNALTNFKRLAFTNLMIAFSKNILHLMAKKLIKNR